MNVIRKILVVEDEEHVLSLIAGRFAAGGYEVIGAGDGDEAIEKYNQENPDLVILDVMIPKLDGYSVAKRIRESEQSTGKRATSIIMLTARTGAKDGRAGYESGANIYLKKPFDPEKLFELVVYHLDNKQ
ncbi:hypothetical protein A2276_07725 [candidate division WOR-1 bacterium RIFOXYA12_FULL_43_27]|uniref:Response regulatory domain-containing protein n=1 Tax=candidate division WOR-1 bacterium RIFOXYC2_FULL_46_14 TaxID=1802587 RepID=A0A1F4U601_UNCSA|nr:MAG: hypothetical protein A2276_07725 [candidate division WOR-1 bacterium RIFOXYA12_FULL_43_27]OGC20487.1 MAG: hypothetical protein A2292_05550 [candidate division WOR-1 bacterium RIFOXYB2_FULL_46_45]OGC31776.1 MAG: hypothetical protein A2232_05900 [candidate division WOR-1 bacterium RIFOXYA2_FULL_46_56]OGC40331.1 MAG: hypothetical protein A2438_03570 [candidate division WOR-1 bacterium RIFOXYC2_FULL_46_14]